MFSEIFGTSRRNRTDELRWLIEDVVDRAIGEFVNNMNEDFDQLGDVLALRSEKLSLEEEIERLNLQEERMQEGFDRREREIEHKVGLDRQRQEQELELTRKMAALEAKEENQEQREELFEERMDFFESEMKEHKALLRDVMNKLPSAEIIARIGSVSKDDDG